MAVKDAKMRLYYFSAIALIAPLVCGKAHGEVSIGAGGTPSYTSPIPVPPGIAGMAPKLALSYGGGGINGPVGYGWSIQGFSTITRCAASIAIDGNKSGVTFGPNDKLCLDGQRLIQTDAA